MNNKSGDLKGYNCPVCLNKGVIYKLDEKGIDFTIPCECKSIRESIKRAARSGFGNLLDTCTFDSFIVTDDWQKNLKNRIKQFADSPSGWLYVCGQPGCGKTHLCTAAAAQMMNGGENTLYVKWYNVSKKLKGLLNTPDYPAEIERLINVDVLYLDDFFKTQQNGTVTNGDINLAFEIIDARYCRDCITVFSSEKTITELLDIDNALGGRIKEKTAAGDYIEIKEDISRDYRLK